MSCARRRVEVWRRMQGRGGEIRWPVPICLERTGTGGGEVADGRDRSGDAGMGQVGDEGARLRGGRRRPASHPPPPPCGDGGGEQRHSNRANEDGDPKREKKMVMRTDPMLWHKVAAASGVAALGLGTYGAHMFRPQNPRYKEIWQTASLYHLVHTTALLGAPLTKRPNIFGGLLTTGIVLFSGTEIARMLADDYDKRVMIVDTSNEIGGDGDIPHPGIGNPRRLQVPNQEMQHKVLIEAVKTICLRQSSLMKLEPS